MKLTTRVLFVALCVATTAIFAFRSLKTGSKRGGSAATYSLVEAFPGLHFEVPVDLTHASDGTNRLFVLEQEGIIRVFDNKSNVKNTAVFLDIKKKVTYGGEQGLLGIAFHPDYKNNGFFYLNYTRTRANQLETAIVRYKVSPANPNQADPASEVTLLTYDQPYANHNGGAVKFGKDGYLYISAGDGGSGGDPHNNGQNKSAFLGKILRIDVNSKEKGNYGIPSDNPFVQNKEGFKEEIYAYGLRNPWRMSFDEETNTLWAGDVGQNAHEEIDIIVKGGNYGWRKVEGDNCFKPSEDCKEPGFVAPVIDLPQSAGEHSITGGFVYRGKNVPALKGKYIYGDYVSGRVFGLEHNNGKLVKNDILVNKAGLISAFGVDADNELYICDYGTGKIWRFASGKI